MNAHPLLQLFDLLAAELAASVPRLSRTNVRFGEEHLTDVDTFPRVIVVPGDDAFGASSSRTEVGGARAMARSLATANTALDFHLWGGDYDASLSMRDALVNALRHVLGANYLLGRGRWEGSQNMAAGRKYVLSLTLDLPIPEAPPRTAVAMAMEFDPLTMTLTPPP